MVIGTLELVLDIHESFSLKDKRRVVKSLKDRLSNRFNISVAEVADLELHNRATLGVAMVSNDAGHAAAALQQVVNFVEGDHRCVLVDYSLDVD